MSNTSNTIGRSAGRVIMRSSTIGPHCGHDTRSQTAGSGLVADLIGQMHLDPFLALGFVELIIISSSLAWLLLPHGLPTRRLLSHWVEPVGRALVSLPTAGLTTSHQPTIASVTSARVSSEIDLGRR